MEKERLYQMIDEREGFASLAFPALMRKVYLWMTLALAITAVTAWGVANSPSLLMAIYGTKYAIWGIIIAELALVFTVSATRALLLAGRREEKATHKTAHAAA